MHSTNRHRIAALAGLAVVAMAAAACSSGSGSSGDATAISTDTNKTLTIAVATDPTSLDPCDTQGANGVGTLRRNVTESLTDVDPKTGKVVPLLALSWTQDNPTTWTFKLRSNVKFQDGSPFDASAAAFGITRTLQPKLNCLNLENFPDPLTATAVGPLTLKVVTKQPDPILPLRISYADLVSPKTSMTAKTTHPVGTGPYEFASRTPGQNMKFKRFAGYWGAKPQAANVTYIFRSENAVRADTAKTNEAGIAVPIALQDATSNSRTRQYTQDRVFFLRLETNKAPLNDIRVRQAIGYAIDKNKIVGALMGKGGKPTDQMLAPSVNGYIPGYQGPSYDLGKAKSMLAAAKSSGVDTSKQIKLITRGTLFPGSDDVLQAVVQGLNDAGLNVKMIDLDDDAYLTQLKAPNNTSQPVNMMAVTHDNESGDASFSFPKYLGSTGAVSTIHDPQLDTLLNQANLAEGAQRASLYQQAARWEYEHDAAIVPIAEQFSVLLLANGVEYTPNGLTGIELKASDVHFTK